MSDDWDFYLDDNGGNPASVQIDLGIARSTHVTGYDSLAWLRVAMRMPTLDGLSSNAEFQDLKQIGDAAVAAVEDDGAGIFVGRITTRGQRMFYFYAMDVEHVSRTATQVMQQFPAYQFAVGGESDPLWNTYWRVLYPSAAAQQRMSNRDVLRVLAERGDDHDAPRIIEHFAYFKTAAGREAFISALAKQGFEVRRSGPERQGEFPLLFSREDRPAAIDSITDGLVPLIDENQGVYDGWGCEVVK